jgi:hypothetical protein
MATDSAIKGYRSGMIHGILFGIGFTVTSFVIFAGLHKLGLM